MRRRLATRGRPPRGDLDREPGASRSAGSGTGGLDLAQAHGAAVQRRTSGQALGRPRPPGPPAPPPGPSGTPSRPGAPRPRARCRRARGRAADRGHSASAVCRRGGGGAHGGEPAGHGRRLPDAARRPRRRRPPRPSRGGRGRLGRRSMRPSRAPRPASRRTAATISSNSARAASAADGPPRRRGPRAAGARRAPAPAGPRPGPPARLPRPPSPRPTGPQLLPVGRRPPARLAHLAGVSSASSCRRRIASAASCSTSTPNTRRRWACRWNAPAAS
jgi:hypothetical protein